MYSFHSLFQQKAAFSAFFPLFCFTNMSRSAFFPREMSFLLFLLTFLQRRGKMFLSSPFVGRDSAFLPRWYVAFIPLLRGSCQQSCIFYSSASSERGDHGLQRSSAASLTPRGRCWCLLARSVASLLLHTSGACSQLSGMIDYSDSSLFSPSLKPSLHHFESALLFAGELQEIRLKTGTAEVLDKVLAEVFDTRTCVEQQRSARKGFHPVAPQSSCLPSFSQVTFCKFHRFLGPKTPN